LNLLIPVLEDDVSLKEHILVAYNKGFENNSFYRGNLSFLKNEKLEQIFALAFDAGKKDSLLGERKIDEALTKSFSLRDSVIKKN
jgi:hypothetical protein